MSEKIADAVEGFGQMDARQQTQHTWTVTSWRHDTITSHTVDLLDVKCTCKDFQMNCKGDEVCAHIMVANHTAQARMDTEQALLYYTKGQIDRIEAAVEDLKQSTTAVHADAKAAASDGSQASSNDTSDDSVDDPVAAFNDLLEERGLDASAFDVHIDDQFGSLQATNDGYLEDDEFSTWQDIADELGLTWDNDNGRYYLKPEEFGVLA